MEEDQLIEIKYDRKEIHYTTRLYGLTRDEKLIIIGRLEEIKQDILEDLY